MSHAVWLRLLLALFLFRVVAQPLSLVVGIRGLPPFGAWQSGAVPYPLLLVSQIAILAVFTSGMRAVARGTAQLGPRTGVWLFAFGTMYFMGMVLRLVLGMTTLRGHAWFDRPIPSVFHLVLAASVMVYAHFQWRYGRP